MTIPRLKAINRYWAMHPPISWLKGAQMGYKAPVVNAPAPATKRASVDALMATFGMAPGRKVRV